MQVRNENNNATSAETFAFYFMEVEAKNGGNV